MLIDMDPRDYPMTEEEADAFDESFFNGEIKVSYGSGPGTYEETEAWVNKELARQELLIQEAEEIQNGNEVPDMRLPQSTYSFVDTYAKQYDISINTVIVRMLRGELPLEMQQA